MNDMTPDAWVVLGILILLFGIPVAHILVNALSALSAYLEERRIKRALTKVLDKHSGLDVG